MSNRTAPAPHSDQHRFDTTAGVAPTEVDEVGRSIALLWSKDYQESARVLLDDAVNNKGLSMDAIVAAARFTLIRMRD